MRADWPEAARSKKLRQWHTLEQLANLVEATPQFNGLILLGSLASGTGDAVSDIDVVIAASDGNFAEAWARRNDLHVTGAIAVWEHHRPDLPEVAAHAWLTEDVILVEALIATAGSGARLAEPAIVLVGRMELTRAFPSRPPISRSEMRPAHDPVERAYDVLKQAVRQRRLEEGRR